MPYRILLLLLLILPAACGRRPGSTESTLRQPLLIEPASMDPALLFEGETGGLLQNVYEGLVGFDERNQVKGALAERWEVSRDARVYRFQLKRGVRFHNGRELEAADVKYSLERALRPETRSTSAPTYLGEIQGAAEVAAGKTRDLTGVKAPDSGTVVITLKRPRGYFLQSLAYPTGWVVCREAIEKNGGILDARAAVGTGPFRLTEYRHRARVVLTANRDYHGGRPGLARIERPIVPDAQTRHLMYENGELDLIGVTAADFLRDQKDPRLRGELHRFPIASVQYLCMHPRLQPAFRDLRVRRAMAMAIDRDEIVRVASHGLWQRADGLLPPGMPGYDPELPRLPFDPVYARNLFAEAGYPDGRGFPPLTLIYSPSVPERSAMAQIIRAALRTNLGLQVEIQEREAAVFIQDRRDEKMSFYIGAWDSDYIDPQNTLSTLLHSRAPLNDFGYRNPRFDTLCERADSELDMSKRIPLYREAERIAMSEVALLPLVFGQSRLLIKPHVRDLQHNLMGLLPMTKVRIQR